MEVQGIISQISPNFPKKVLQQAFSLQFSAVVATRLFLLPNCYGLEIWFSIAQLKIRPLNCATALSKDSWLSILDYLRQSFEVFHSYSSRYCQQQISDPAEVGLTLEALCGHF